MNQGETMTEPPPRKRFQIHLSTAIVLMFVAGALIWANVQRWRPMSRPPRCRFYGWPCFVVDEYFLEVNYLMALINVLVAIMLLMVISFLCEWFIYYGKKESARRRRVARK